jgi:Poly(R)-hydroxyalkanoic acid synthase subunit (PHA_synth_III_E)
MSGTEHDREWRAPAFEASGWLQQMTGPWNALAGMWEAWFDAAKSLSHERGLNVGKSLTRLFDPEFWRSGGFAPLLEELQDALSLPRFADLPRVEASLLHSSAAMLDLFRLFQQYLLLSIPIWAAASQRFQAEMAERVKKEGKAKSPGEALDLWNGVLDRTMMEFNRSGDYARMQQQLLRASSQHRLELRRIGEQSARMFDLPTRKEMTDIYRRLHELQREVYGLRRELRELRNGRASASDRTGASAEQEDSGHD